MRNNLRAWRALALVALAALPACQLLYGEDEVGLRGSSAIIIYERSRTDDAHRAAVILEREGLSVQKQVQGPIGPETSRIRVHDVMKFPERVPRLREVLEKKVELTWIESTTTDTHDVYVWLVD